MPFESRDFSRRARLPELMDGSSTYEGFRACLHDLEKMNKTVSAYSSLHKGDGAVRGEERLPALCEREVEIEERWPTRLRVSRC